MLVKMPWNNGKNEVVIKMLLDSPTHHPRLQKALRRTCRWRSGSSCCILGLSPCVHVDDGRALHPYWPPPSPSGDSLVNWTSEGLNGVPALSRWRRWALRRDMEGFQRWRTEDGNARFEVKITNITYSALLKRPVARNITQLTSFSLWLQIHIRVLDDRLIKGLVLNITQPSFNSVWIQM